MFLSRWADAALTSLGFFWMAFWAFCVGYLISSAIQVFVTEDRMQRTMGRAGPGAIARATFFGFVSSSCSFAALSTARALFQKGASLAPALAFLLASTNLVIELGILVYIFLSWQFVVGEYLGGLLLIGFTWALVQWTLPRWLEEEARTRAGEAEAGGSEEPPDWRRLIGSVEGWRRVGRRYEMEWGMVWKDVAFGFTVAGIIAAFVPDAFFRALFVGSGTEAGPAVWQIVAHTLIGPVAAFFTFIGSMGNIPLAAVLFGSGVSFAGVLAFIFSDLVVFPVLRISAGYFGWRMAFYILAVFLAALVATSLLLHAGLDALALLPEASAARVAQIRPEERFAIDATFFLDVAAVVLSAGLVLLARSPGGNAAEHGDDGAGDDADHGDHGGGASLLDRALSCLAFGSFAWLLGGLGIGLLLGRA